jgi:hypothetical protein
MGTGPGRGKVEKLIVESGNKATENHREKREPQRLKELSAVLLTSAALCGLKYFTISAPAI